MSLNDLHEVIFNWPHSEPSNVIVTGTFDQWSRSVPLKKTSTGYEAAVRVPWNEKVKYKFIVDGQWILRENQPTEVDFGGYVNNVYIAPPKPAPPPPSTPEVVNPPSQTVDPSQATTTLEESASAKPAVVSPSLESAPAEVAPPALTTLNDGKDIANGTLKLPTEASPPIIMQKKETEKSDQSSPTVSPDVHIDIVPGNTSENTTVASPNVASSTTDIPTEFSTHAPLKPVDLELSPATVIAPTKADEITEVHSATATSGRTSSITRPTSSDFELTSETPTTPTTPAPSLPTTPVKSSKFSFPRNSDSQKSSPASSRVGTTSSRKKRHSIFGKMKALFHHDKDKDKQKA